MLSDRYRYVALDFETTGLDLEKDEAIQIGIVEIDVNGNIVNQFKSFLKPEKNISELKSLVAYITGISIQDIQGAPSIFDLKDEILKYFGNNTIIIGHNIEFDINFMKKYFPDIEYFDSIDTFYLAQNLIHFPLSYALDVLVESLMTNKKFKDIFLKIHGNEDYDNNKIHDGLYDSLNSVSLFLYEINRISMLFVEYPILNKFLEENVGLYNKILVKQADRAGKKNGKIIIPALKRQLPGDTSLKTDLKIDLKNCKNGERYFVGNVDICQLIQSLVSSNKSIILAFSNVAKLNIAKNILNETGIKNIGFTKGYQTINQKNLLRFLSKKFFSDEEFLFIIKYFSHLFNDGSILDLNTKMDYKINYYIQDEKKFEKYPIVLTTHGGLYSILKDEQHKYQDYDVCFFDIEMWYRGYNEYLSHPVDLYSILNFLDILFYKYDLDGQENSKNAIEKFASFFEIFMGVLFSETKKLFVNISDEKLTVNPIIDNINFYETNKLIAKISEHKVVLQECLEDQDFQVLLAKLDHMNNVLSGLIDVKKVMYNQSDFYFTYSEAVKYTNWDEFKDIFQSNVYFFSDWEKSYPVLVSCDEKYELLPMRKISNIDKVVGFCCDRITGNDGKTCFVLSTIKQESKEIFDKLVASELLDTSLLVENITGSLGKNVFKAKKIGSKIIIGGYSFLIWLISNKIDIDICVDFNIIGKMSKYLLDDIQRYGRSNNNK